MTRAAALLAAAGLALIVAAPAGGSDAGGAARAPVVDQMVVFPGGKAVRKHVSTRALGVKVGGRRCRAGAGTALPALIRSHSGRVRLRDFGSCSDRAADGSSLFVRGIGPYRNKGRDGWVYKVGKRAATAGAADPSGPFGSGRLRSKQRVTWFYCRLEADGCQRTLALRARPEGGGIGVTVRGYDDEGGGQAEPSARVVVNGATQLTGSDGESHFALPAGSYRAYATKSGRVRSFTERIVVK